MQYILKAGSGHSELDGMGSISAIRNVPSLLYHERLNEARLSAILYWFIISAQHRTNHRPRIAPWVCFLPSWIVLNYPLGNPKSTSEAHLKKKNVTYISINHLCIVNMQHSQILAIDTCEFKYSWYPICISTICQWPDSKIDRF